MAAIVEADHTEPGAFGYLLSQIAPRPQLTVVTHSWTVDDTVGCALNRVRKHFSGGGYPRFGKDIVRSTKGAHGAAFSTGVQAPGKGCRAGVSGGAARRYCAGHAISRPSSRAAWSGQ